MTLSFHNGKVVLHAGDCREVLRELPANSIDAVVTDPPYHLTSIVKRFGGANASPAKGNEAFVRASRGFMGKQWDGGDIAFTPELWAEVLRVLKPGGHMACFGGTRTYHRMASAIEDAGFEIRDAIMWHYGSGFPKSHDVSKGIDKAAGAEREIIGPRPNVHSRGAHSLNEGWRRPWMDRPDAVALSMAETAPATDAARQWQGWGTALKPSTEIICLARKPLSEGTVAANVLRWGTGAINIAGCRIGSGGQLKWATPRGMGSERSFADDAWTQAQGRPYADATANPQGRWPANIIHDGSPEVLAGFPESTSSAGNKNTGNRANGLTIGNGLGAGNGNGIGGDSGSAARFFYTAKAGKNDRISRTIESVRIEWISGQEQCRVVLPVDTEQLQRKGIVVFPSDTSSEWNTFLSGNSIMDLCRKASICTIRTATISTTSSQTWSWLTRLLTNESIRAVNYETANGSSPAETAETSGPSLIITLGETVSLPGANLAISGTLLRISVNAKLHAHPTVKPVNLMQWLVRLICPEGGTVLDPFAGTGTTGAATFIEGCRAVLIEREAEYLADIERRMELLLSGPDERARKLAKPDPHEFLPLFGVVHEKTGP